MRQFVINAWRGAVVLSGFLLVPGIHTCRSLSLLAGRLPLIYNVANLAANEEGDCLNVSDANTVTWGAKPGRASLVSPDAVPSGARSAIPKRAALLIRTGI
jgi:hypothetical protein